MPQNARDHTRAITHRVAMLVAIATAATAVPPGPALTPACSRPTLATNPDSGGTPASDSAGTR